MNQITKMDHQENPDTIDIGNMNWADYSNIMISLDEMIKQLSKNIGDSYLDSHREQLLKKYQDLFQRMKANNGTWRGQGVSLDDEVIAVTKKIL